MHVFSWCVSQKCFKMGKLSGGNGGGGGNAHYSNHGFDASSEGASGGSSGGVTLTSVIVVDNGEGIGRTPVGSGGDRKAGGVGVGGAHWRERVLHTLNPNEERKLGAR